MSEWRQKGFVQDSDEEEQESQLDSQNSWRNGNFHGRVQSIQEAVQDEEKHHEATTGLKKEETSTVREEKALTGNSVLLAQIEDAQRLPPERSSPKHPTASPAAPLSALESPESPDPLQSSLTPTSRRIWPTPLDYLQMNDSRAPSVSPEPQCQAPTAISPQIMDDPLAQTCLDTSNNGQTTNPTSNILTAFGIEPLSDASDDESLSDPPTDLESPDSSGISPLPHRKTAVQVVISSSTALQRHLTLQEEHEQRREFRQRKPIQLYPYALEGERYRREVQSRGLKPVPRPRSPVQRAAQVDDEMQEKDFDPNDIPPSSSPLEPVIPVSTPVISKSHKDKVHGSSVLRRASDKTSRRVPATQLHIPQGAKRRRLNLTLTQLGTNSARELDEEVIRRDIWSIPPNSPPYSSSPPPNSARSTGRPRVLALATPAPNLPTPSTSSVIHDDPQLYLELDSDHVPHSITRPSSELRRPTRVILSDKSSAASGSSSDTEPSDNEFRKVKKKIKGVLPASWLRFDQQVQDRRKARALERSLAQAATSPVLTEPQRGVAQRVVKRTGETKKSISGTSSTDVVMISDGSENEAEDALIYDTTRDMQNSVKDAAALAASLDARYQEEDDLASMEHDRLDLFALGGRGPSKKKQMKLTTTFGRAKKHNDVDDTIQKRIPKTIAKMKHAARIKNRNPPPALSIVDIDISPYKSSNGMPHFLRLARRQALRRPDLARQSPKAKQIRLQNSHDTGEANSTLQRWRQGEIKPSARYEPPRDVVERSPLVDKIDNQQRVYSEPRISKGALHEAVVPEAATHTRSRQQRNNVSSALQIFTREPTSATRGSKRAKSRFKTGVQPKRLNLKAHLSLRTAQLESDEAVFGRSHRKTAFEQGLRHVDHQAMSTLRAGPQYMNAQLARFLADDETALPPLPSAGEIGEDQDTNKVAQINTPRRRLIRKKPQAKRLDIDTRDYRQPSEPAIEEILDGSLMKQMPAATNFEVSATSLQGLGSYGTRYPTTFDVTSLPSDTYFHSSTLVGSEDFRRALSISHPSSRNLDEPAGYCTIAQGETELRCGPWNDTTSAGLYDMIGKLTSPLRDETQNSKESTNSKESALIDLARFLRSLIKYISDHLSFSDPIDRKDYVTKMHQMTFTLFDQISVLCTTSWSLKSNSEISYKSIRVMTYLLVLGIQTIQISQASTLDVEVQAEVLGLSKSMAQSIVRTMLQQGIPEVSQFLERNKQHLVRQNGIQDDNILVESIVVCMHSLECCHMPGYSFWDAVNQELTSVVTGATHIRMFECAWASLFTLLPFMEVDMSGIPIRERRESFVGDNWSCITTMLKQLFDLYPSTYKKNSSSVNDYVRASLARCHRLIRHWHWHKPEQMLNAVFDFFGKNSLRQLRRETRNGSAQWLDGTDMNQSLTLEPNESSFRIALKCLALGLGGMKNSYTEKKIRSFVFRTIPNHGRSYPKDQPLDEESLTALRNHHDLLCTLHWAAPPSCRPRLDLIRGLVSHETSHREACRVNVRSWANLAKFQLAADEPYESAKAIALWHKDIMHQTLKQYRLAKTEAEEYLKSSVADGTSEVSVVLVRQTMEKNQEQVIATMRDCISGVRNAIKQAKHRDSSQTFILDCDVVHLLELPHFEDRRLVNVIRDVLALLRDVSYSQMPVLEQRESQATSEESQDYGDFPDFDDFDDIDMDTVEDVQQILSFDFLQTPLWRLLSNAFGAETSPEDPLLMDCVDTWVLVADHQVVTRQRSWSYYLDSFSQVSWQQLRPTDQTRKYSPYFLASLIERNHSAFEDHRYEIMTALLVSLADRESMLRFQYRLLLAVMQGSQGHPLLENLPFYRDQENDRWDINADSVRSRRLALISSMLCNIRDDVQRSSLAEDSRLSEVKGLYGAMLKSFMMRMMSNYQQLQQGSTVTGAYVEFVQKIVQFLKQYTNDICPVLPFFTDSITFPLPATDPTYVVGRLCGYAPKANHLGTAKQLSVFIQTVAQQAAADGHQNYLVKQLATALCSDENPASDRASLRSVLLQGIFPTYLEHMFSSGIIFIITRPIVRSVQSILKTMIFDLRIEHDTSLSTIVESLAAIYQAFIRGTQQLSENSETLLRPYVLAALTDILEAIIPSFPLLDYICGRTLTRHNNRKPSLVTHMEKLCSYIDEVLHQVAIPMTTIDTKETHAPQSGTNADLLAFCKKGLMDSVRTNWTEDQGAIWFGQGNAKRMISVDIGSIDEERMKLVTAIQMFRQSVREIFDDDVYDGGQGSMSDEVFV